MSVVNQSSRVAGVALALSLGLVVATGHGVAAAEPASTDSAGDSTSTSSADSSSRSPVGSADSADDDKGTVKDTDKDTDTESPQPATSPGDSDEPGGDADAGTDVDDDSPTEPQDDKTSDEPVEPATPEDPVAEADSAGDTDTPDVAEADHESTSDRDPVERPDRASSATSETIRESAAPGEPPTTPPATRPIAVDAAPATVRPPTATTVEAADVSQPRQVEATPLTATPVAQAFSPPSLIGGVVNAVTASAAAILGVFSRSAMGSPQSPFAPLRGLLELVFAARRPFTGLLANTAPSAVTASQTQQTTGEVTGTITAGDVDGDALIYGVGQAPTNGNVQVFADGSYVYVPSRELSAAGGTDTFTVVVDDNHRALLQSVDGATQLSLFTGTGRTVVPITVNVTPRSQVNEIFESFSIINLTTNTLVYRGLSIAANDVDAPPVGAQLKPGEKHEFQVSYYVTSTSRGQAAYSLVENNTTVFSVMMSVGAWGASKGLVCNTGRCETENMDIAYLVDAPNTVIEVDATKAHEVADFLNELCKDNGRAKCSFDYKHSEKAFTDPHGVGNAVVNDVPEINPKIITIKDDQTQTTTFTVGTKVSANLLKLISAEVSAASSREVTKTYSFTQSITANVPGHTRMWVVGQQPVIRDYGDLTVKLGNTTYIMRDAYLDSPDTSGQSRYIVHSEPYPPTAANSVEPQQSEPEVVTPVEDVQVTLVPAPRTQPAATPLASAGARSPLEILAAVGRQVWRGFVNNAPTAAPVLDAQTAGGTITGTVGAVDVDGDGVTYSVEGGPANGHVVVNADGTFVYTPDAAFAGAGGVDMFTVTVSDNRSAWLQMGSNGMTPSAFGTPVAVTVPVVLTVVSTKAPVEAPTSGITLGFDIINTTSIPLVFRGYSFKQADVENGPRVGSVLQPGEIQRFNVSLNVIGAQSVNPVYGTATGDLYELQLTTSPFGRDGRCFKISRGGCSTDDSTSVITLKDSPGTVIELTADQGGNLLNRLCGSGGPANCKITIVSDPVKTFTEPRALGAAVQNLSTAAVTTGFTVTEIVGGSSSLTISGKVSASFAAFLNAEFNTAYGYRYTDTKTFTDSLPAVTVPQGQIRSVTFIEPIIRVRGDFEVTMGDTTFHVRGVNLDTPDVNGQGTLHISDKPLS